MSDYYNAKRSGNLFDPRSNAPFKLSRSKIDLFINCPRCFYLDRRLGIGQPGGFPFTLNSAVDALLKKEFDIHRANQTAHPLMKYYGIDAVPFAHEDMDKWRENFVGVQYHHKPTNFIVTGAVDDIWHRPHPDPLPTNSAGKLRKEREIGELIVVDYKATSVNEEITGLDKPWHAGYKRQMEIYQWLLRQNGYTVADTGYFVYANGKKDRAAFDAKLEFDIVILPYKGNDDWVEGKITEAQVCLVSDTIPAAGKACDFCAYRAEAGKVEK
jgi:hypothetical protein